MMFQPKQLEEMLHHRLKSLRESIKSITNRTGDIGKDMSNLKNEIGGISFQVQKFHL